MSRPILTVGEQAECGVPVLLKNLGVHNASPEILERYTQAMVEAIITIMQHEAAIHREQARYVTPDQHQVLGLLLAHKLLYKQIAQLLGLTLPAVRSLVHRAYQAMGVKTKREARRMYERGLVLERPAKGGLHAAKANDPA